MNMNILGWGCARAAAYGIAVGILSIVPSILWSAFTPWHSFR